VVVLRLNVNLEPVAERLDHWFICVPLLSVSVIVTLSILVVPDAPLIVTSQFALFPENVRVKLCVLIENGSITTNAEALIVKHRIEMQSTNVFKILFIFEILHK
jgi:hypothetical protein